MPSPLGTVFCCTILTLCATLGINATVEECSGVCTTNPIGCKLSGGIVTNLCPSKTDFCCDTNESTKELWGTCGAFKEKGDQPYLLFQSPKFPLFSSGDMLCSFTFELKEDTAAVLLDFQMFLTDGGKLGSPHFECDEDMFFIKGFPSWMPPALCGNMRGYKMVIDQGKLKDIKNLTLHGVMTTNYQWSIKIVQIPLEKCPSEQPAAMVRLEGGGNSRRAQGYTRDAYGELKHKTVKREVNIEKTRHHPLPIAVSKMGESHHRARRTPGMPTLETRVMNGIDTSLGAVPWQASLRVDLRGIQNKKVLESLTQEGCDVEEGAHRCGGTVISDREILTAAHCFFHLTKMQRLVPLQHLQVFLGDVDKCHKDPETQVYNVETVVLHFAFEMSAVMNDVAIIRLNSTIGFNENIKPIRMAAKGEMFFGQDAFASGWGQTDVHAIKDQGANVLQHTDNLQISSYKTCGRFTQSFLGLPRRAVKTFPKYWDLFESIMCTQTKNNTLNVLMGRGDSGGPLVVHDAKTKEPVIVGVVSYSLSYSRRADQIELDFKDFFQSVPFFRNWIDATRCTLNVYQRAGE